LSYTNRKDFGLGSRQQLIPTATVLDFAGGAAPAGFLLCDGSIVRREDYDDLFQVISTTYNTGGEAGYQFRLPDLRGRVAVGKDNMGGTAASRVTTGVSGLTGTTLGASGGHEALQAHTHLVDESPYTGTGNTIAVGANPVSYANNSGTKSTGAGNAQNVQPSLILNKIIKY
jgi:microcystin-dependent protein